MVQPRKSGRGPKKAPTKKKKKKKKKVPKIGGRTGSVPVMKKNSGVGSQSSGVIQTVKKRAKKKGDFGGGKRGDHTVHVAVPRRQGMGLAAKLTMFVVLLLGVIVGVTILIDYKRLVNNYTEAIDIRGVRLCEAYMSLEKKYLDISESDVKLLRMTKEYLKENSGIIVEGRSEELEQERKKGLEQQVLGHKVSSFKTEEVIQIFYSRGTEAPYAPGQTIVTEQELGTNLNLKGQASIRIGTLINQQGQVVPIRSYNLRHPDRYYDVTVILDNTKLDDLHDSVRNTSILIALISLAAGVMGVTVLAHQISKPIKQLAEDMLIVARGELGHLSHVSSKDEVGVLAKTFNLMSKDLDISHEAELQKIEQDKDLELAKNVQISLVPTKVPDIEGCSIAPFYRSAKEVGGDYYDVVEMDDEHTALFVADVSGKGVQGAMIMAMTRGIAHSETKSCTNFSPSWILSQVNSNLARDLKPGSFVTAMCMIINKKTGLCKLASAGHNPLVLIRNKAKDWETLNPTGIALGFDKGVLFNRTIKDQEFQLNLGDRVVLYTDGVVEAMSESKEEYGMERFRRFCVKYAPLKSDVFVQQLVKSLDIHKGAGPQHDDITIISLRKLK